MRVCNVPTESLEHSLQNKVMVVFVLVIVNVLTSIFIKCSYFLICEL